MLFEDTSYPDGYSPPLAVAQRYVIVCKEDKKKWKSQMNSDVQWKGGLKNGSHFWMYIIVLVFMYRSVMKDLCSVGNQKVHVHEYV